MTKMETNHENISDPLEAFPSEVPPPVYIRFPSGVPPPVYTCTTTRTESPPCTPSLDTRIPVRKRSSNIFKRLAQWAQWASALLVRYEEDIKMMSVAIFIILLMMGSFVAGKLILRAKDEQANA